MVSVIEWIAFLVIVAVFTACFFLLLYRVVSICSFRYLIDAECIGIVPVRTVRYNGSVVRVKFRYSYGGIEYVCSCLDLYPRKKVTRYVSGETYRVYINANNPSHVCINNKIMLGDFVSLFWIVVLVVVGVVLLCLESIG